eukprot:3142191-Karenia_brevis.AAC.1
MTAIQKVCEKTGAFVDLERAIPALYRVGDDGVVKEAILDVVILSPGSFTLHALDVTIRCPHGCRNDRGQSLAANQVAVAAKDGELEKLMRYGTGAKPMSIETYGRVGFKSMEELRHLTANISAHRYATTGVTGGRLLAEMRLEIERALYFHLSDTVLRCLGHSSGCHARRRR